MNFYYGCFDMLFSRQKFFNLAKKSSRIMEEKLFSKERSVVTEKLKLSGIYWKELFKNDWSWWKFGGCRAAIQQNTCFLETCVAASLRMISVEISLHFKLQDVMCQSRDLPIYGQSF